MQRRLTRFAGDLQIPPGTRVPAGISASGVLVIGEGAVCSGDVVGLRGVVVSGGARVKGDVSSRGPVLVEAGAVIEGEVHSFADVSSAGELDDEQPGPRPPTGPEPRAQAPERVEALEVELARGAIRDTLSCLLLLALDTFKRRASYAAGTWWGLPDDALEDTLTALRAPIATVYGIEEGERPWTHSDVLDVLLAKVVPLVIPVSVERFGKHRALITAGKPEDLPGDVGSQPGWPIPVLSLVNVLGHAFSPNFKLVTGADGQLPALETDPSSVQAWVSLGE
ncbi:MAG: polymer-forming cytoskeletal protein [Euryarchaeota archaeon]|nr:polymer-forming cytoskeletal protein [Euryarchaeota archaeon]